MRTRPLVLFLAPALLAAQAAPAKDDLDRRLTSYHTRLFAVGNLVTTPFDPQADEVKGWNALMTDIGTFIKAGGDKVQVDDLRTLLAVSTALLGERNRASRTLAGTSGKLPFGKLKELIDGDTALRNRVPSLDKVLANCQKARSDAKKSADDQDRQDVLYRLCLTLQLTVDAYHNHLAGFRKAQQKPASAT